MAIKHHILFNIPTLTKLKLMFVVASLSSNLTNPSFIFQSPLPLFLFKGFDWIGNKAAIIPQCLHYTGNRLSGHVNPVTSAGNFTGQIGQIKVPFFGKNGTKFNGGEIIFKCCLFSQCYQFFLLWCLFSSNCPSLQLLNRLRLVSRARIIAA